MCEFMYRPMGHPSRRQCGRITPAMVTATFNEWQGDQPGHGIGPASYSGYARTQIEKLVPQPQDAVALGLTTRNEAPIRSSTKSTSDPARNGTEAGATRTHALSPARTRSSSPLPPPRPNL